MRPRRPFRRGHDGSVRTVSVSPKQVFAQEELERQRDAHQHRPAPRQMAGSLFIRVMCLPSMSIIAFDFNN